MRNPWGLSRNAVSKTTPSATPHRQASGWVRGEHVGVHDVPQQFAYVTAVPQLETGCTAVGAEKRQYTSQTGCCAVVMPSQL